MNLCLELASGKGDEPLEDSSSSDPDMRGVANGHGGDDRASVLDVLRWKAELDSPDILAVPLLASVDWLAYTEKSTVHSYNERYTKKLVNTDQLLRTTDQDSIADLT